MGRAFKLPTSCRSAHLKCHASFACAITLVESVSRLSLINVFLLVVFSGSNGLWEDEDEPPPPTSPMIGATASRHTAARRRSSTAMSTPSHGGGLLGSRSSGLASLSEAADGSQASSRQPVARRRAVDTSDLRSCALVQTKMKTWKNYPEYVFHPFLPNSVLMFVQAFLFEVTRALSQTDAAD